MWAMRASKFDGLTIRLRDAASRRVPPWRWSCRSSPKGHTWLGVVPGATKALGDPQVRSSLKDIMESIIGRSADVLWGASGAIINKVFGICLRKGRRSRLVCVMWLFGSSRAGCWRWLRSVDRSRRCAGRTGPLIGLLFVAYNPVTGGTIAPAISGSSWLRSLQFEAHQPVPLNYCLALD
jgi:hypothetical protein